jgi:excisionase family DNA binding protein
MKKDDLMTKAEVMAYLRISLATLNRLIKRHAFPLVKLERKVLFRKTDIDAFLESKIVR